VTVLADTGAVYALIDRDDEWHKRVVTWWRESKGAVLLPVTILPEVSYLLHTRIGPHAEEAFVSAVAAGEFVVEHLDLVSDTKRACVLMARYRDVGLGFVDASVVAMAERLGITDLLATDRRRFSLLRPEHVRAFRLRP
jgi:hypothetical protein